MITPDLLNYINSSLASGQTYEIIKQSLLNSGWNLDDINNAFNNINQQIPPQNINQNYQIPTNQVIKKTGWTLGKIISLLVTLSLVVSLIYGGIFAYKIYQNNKTTISKLTSKDGAGGFVSSFLNLLDSSKNGSLNLKETDIVKDTKVNTKISVKNDPMFIKCPDGWEFTVNSNQVMCVNNKPEDNSENFSFNKSVNVSSVEEANTILVDTTYPKADSDGSLKELTDFASSNFGIKATVVYNKIIKETEIQNGQVFSVYGTSSVKAEWPLTYDVTSDIATHIIVCDNGYGKLIFQTSSQQSSYKGLSSKMKTLSTEDLIKSFKCD